MGAFISSSSTEDQKPTISKKQQKAQKAAAWKQVVQQFTEQLLDASFLTLPVRASTIEAAALYPPSNAKHNNATLMPGTHKHLGGAYDPKDGCIYGVPANSRAVLCLCPNHNDHSVTIHYTCRTIPLPAHVADVRMKWLRGIVAHGYLWAIPAWAPAVLCVDIDAFWGRRRRRRRRQKQQADEYVQLLPLPAEARSNSNNSQWQWHGAGMNHEKTAIYCIPSNAQHVLKVDIIHKTTSLIPITFDPSAYPHFDLQLTNKWYGGIVGRDDHCVYGIPYRSGALLQIDTRTDTARLVGPDRGAARYHWHGGICVGGKIYAHPSHADTVLMIDTTTTKTTGGDVADRDLCQELRIERAAYDTDPRQNYKWLGGTVGADANIYCPACDTSAVLKIDTHTDQCSTFGFAGTAKNKWQGGLLSSRDGCVYCIPANGRQVLRIHTNPVPAGQEQPIQLIGDLPAHKDKWQGGSEGKDGCLYFIPENGYRVLKVTPPDRPPTLVDGQLPENDVKLEFL